MLLGVREARARSSSRPDTGCACTSRSGERWYEYSLRRLQENPAMAGDDREGDRVGGWSGRPS